MCDRAPDYHERVTGARAPCELDRLHDSPPAVGDTQPSLVFEDLRAVSCMPDSADRLHAVCMERQPLIDSGASDGQRRRQLITSSQEECCPAGDVG
jgi:hypothetical protein